MENNTVTFNFTSDTNQFEMLRIAKDGFYIRGEKIEQDKHEAEKVYNAFTQWLTWSLLTQH